MTSSILTQSNSQYDDAVWRAVFVFAQHMHKLQRRCRRIARLADVDCRWSNRNRPENATKRGRARRCERRARPARILALGLLGVLGSVSLPGHTAGPNEAGTSRPAQAPSIPSPADLQSAVEKRDWATAFRLSEALAQQNLADAHGVLGLIYYHGLGVPRDLEQAEYWLDKAVDGGFERAHALLAQVYMETGRATRARVLLERAADAGNSDAMLMLFTIYAAGQGVIKDDGKALGWLVKAAPNHQDARHLLERLAPSTSLALALSKEKHTDTRRDIRDQAVKHAATRDVMALARMYDEGLGVKRDFRTAAQWYGVAARQGSASAQFSYAALLASKTQARDLLRPGHGSGATVDRPSTKLFAQLALDHYYAAATQGHRGAMQALATYYTMRSAGTANAETAARWQALAQAKPSGPRSRDGFGPSAPADSLPQAFPDKPIIAPASFSYAVVTGNRVNVRAHPNRRSRIMQRVDRGQPVLESTRAGEWAQVEILDRNQHLGWIHTSLLKTLPR